MKTKYKIVYRNKSYYAYFRKWWIPFYIPCFWSTFEHKAWMYEEGAKSEIEQHKLTRTVYEEK